MSPAYLNVKKEVDEAVAAEKPARPGILARMESGEFLVSVQIDPPSSGSIEELTETIAKLHAAGAGIVDINSSRRISHDSIQLAVALSQMGIETIPHVTTRDSSVNGIINQILAAYSWGGVRNYLIITGDPYEAEQAVIPSRGVFQTDSVGAIQKVDEYLRKNSKKPALNIDITLAAAVNQNEDLVREKERIRAKESAGADFFMSQPVFSEWQAQRLCNFYYRYSAKPLIVGVWPLVHRKTIEAIRAGKIVGVALPDEVYEEAEAQKNDESLRQWGLAKARALIEFVTRTRANGVYIVAPNRNPLLLLDILGRVIASP